MKKYTRVLGIFMLAASLAFTACFDDDEDSPDPVAEFKITCEQHANGGVFNGTPATGETATWEMTQENVGYWSYRIEFIEISGNLPDNVNVTLAWTKDTATNFWWGNSIISNDTVTFSVPKTGGTIGYKGTVLDSSGNARPTVQGTTSGKTAGTVTFEARYVKTLTLTVLR